MTIIFFRILGRKTEMLKIIVINKIHERKNEWNMLKVYGIKELIWSEKSYESFVTIWYERSKYVTEYR